MSDEILRYISALEQMELRLALKCRIRFLGECLTNETQIFKDNIIQCAQLYARMRGVEPHNNAKLQIVRSLKIKRDWRTNPDHSYKKELKRC